MPLGMVLRLVLFLALPSQLPGQAATECHDSSPGVCCQQPAGICGLARCEDYKKLMPDANRSAIHGFGCGGAPNCCFYAAPGGLYCQSCGSPGVELAETTGKTAVTEHVRVGDAALRGGDECRDSSPGVCCQQPAGICGLARCEDYKKLMPDADRSAIHGFGCGGAPNCCFYAAPGGLYCQSCGSQGSGLEEAAGKDSVTEKARMVDAVVAGDECRDSSPGVCCQQPAGKCGLARCEDYKKLLPDANQSAIHGFGCSGAPNCCFYAAPGGLYCQSCGSPGVGLEQNTGKDAVTEHARVGDAAVRGGNECRDSSPGVCCQQPAGICGLARCEDYKKVMPDANRSAIHDFGCGGAANCCFYAAPGGLYCQSCGGEGRGLEKAAQRDLVMQDARVADVAVLASNMCHDEAPGVCCQQPAGICGLARCEDYKKVMPDANRSAIHGFGCDGAPNCCFYAAPGGLYCQSCGSPGVGFEETTGKDAVTEHARVGDAAVRGGNECRDSSPGVCCQQPAGICGLARCEDYKKVMPDANRSAIHDFGCGGSPNCCFYPAPGGLFCHSCTGTASSSSSSSRPQPIVV